MRQGKANDMGRCEQDRERQTRQGETNETGRDKWDWERQDRERLERETGRKREKMGKVPPWLEHQNLLQNVQWLTCTYKWPQNWEYKIKHSYSTIIALITIGHILWSGVGLTGFKRCSVPQQFPFFCSTPTTKISCLLYYTKNYIHRLPTYLVFFQHNTALSKMLLWEKLQMHLEQDLASNSHKSLSLGIIWFTPYVQASHGTICIEPCHIRIRSVHVRRENNFTCVSYDPLREQSYK